ncbi:hypothetical protein BDW68DRAFT_171295 [Aspergillus falconensis]
MREKGQPQHGVLRRRRAVDKQNIPVSTPTTLSHGRRSGTSSTLATPYTAHQLQQKPSISRRVPLEAILQNASLSDTNLSNLMI